MPRLLISACLCGIPCRYDGTGFHVPCFARLLSTGEALPVCPEELAGLGTPREPCELRRGRVTTRAGLDVTGAFARGAERALELALRHGIRVAVLKEKSPSCGVSFIYDGTFEGRLVPGMGLTAALLAANAIAVYSDRNVPEGILIG